MPTNSSDFYPQDVDLSTCDDEPIQYPGSIQPHGILLVLSEPDYTIQVASASTQLHFGISPAELLNAPLSALLGEAFSHDVIAELNTLTLTENPQVISSYNTSDAQAHSQMSWNVIVHRYAGHLIVELENGKENARLQNQLFSQLTQSIFSIKHTDTYEAFLQQATLEIKKLSQFDRVMVYKFDEDGHGQVIGEAKEASLEPFLGQRYPASDIPKQARALYLKNHLRFISDVNYQPSPLIGVENKQAYALDLSRAVLRSVSPIHIEYLQNMGVAATMVISLIKNGELWGLIACHHNSAKYVNYDVRATCENFAHFVMLELIAREQFEEEQYRIRLKSMQAEFVEFMLRQEQLIDGLIAFQPNLGDFIDSSGCVISLADELQGKGETPPSGFIYQLGLWLSNTQKNSTLYSTNALPKEFEPALEFANMASGLLAIPLSSNWRDFVFWFRPETIQTVEWAGDPNNAVKVQKNGARLTPRGSFELWKETVKLQSTAWHNFEVDAALELKQSIQFILLQKTEILEERERQFRTLANSVPQLAWVGDGKGRIYWFNQRWYDYTGTDPEWMTQNGWQPLHHPAHYERVLNRLKACWENGEAWEDSFPLKGKDGNFRWFLSQALPVKNKDGHVVSWFGTHTDITAQLEVEAALRESEARFRTLTDSMPQIVWSAQPNGKFDYYNQQCFEMTGLDLNNDPTGGDGWVALIHPDDCIRVVDTWAKSVASGMEFSIEFRLKLKTKQYCNVLARALPMLKEDGSIFRWFGTYTDISDIVEARETLAQSREELEVKIAERTSQLQSVNQELEAFSYSVSHDLRAPLRGIDGFSMALLEDYGDKLDENAQEFLTHIRRETGRMGLLIDGLLNLSRLTRREITRKQVNLSEIASELATKLQAESPERKCRFAIQPDLNGQADWQLTFAILQNLMENAWKFTVQKDVTEIEFGQTLSSNNLPIYFVKDNGVGFDMNYADKLFGAFQRLHSVREFPGTGIGLATVKRIVHRHGGEIWADSKLNEGSTFYFTLQADPSIPTADFKELNKGRPTLPGSLVL